VVFSGSIRQKDINSIENYLANGLSQRHAQLMSDRLFLEQKINYTFRKTGKKAVFWSNIFRYHSIDQDYKINE